MAEPVCLVTGVGPGSGAAFVRRFASGGYRVAMLARTASRLEELAASVPATVAYPVDVGDPEALGATYARIRSDLGDPQVVIHNAVGGSFGNFLEIEADQLLANFRTNALGLLNLAQLACPAMI